MSSRNAKLLDFYAGKAWAMPEANLQEMYQIYRMALERKEIGAYLDPEAVLAKTGKPLDNTRNVTVRDGVAVIPVSGPIFRYANLFTEISGATSIQALAKDFRQSLDDRAVRAIVLEINSPGGEADGTAELAQHILEARGQKPIIAYVSHLGASAAYWLASAADEIVANDAASLGSIGVVASVCIHKDKNHLEFVSSQSPNKRPDPQSEAGKSQIQEWLDSLGDVFINTVARNREMTPHQVIDQGGRGGLKVGQKAVDAGLADRLGTLEGLIAELAA
jgi:ClpP class serine protease